MDNYVGKRLDGRYIYQPPRNRHTLQDRSPELEHRGPVARVRYNTRCQQLDFDWRHAH